MGHHVLSHPSLEGAHPVSYLSSPEYDEIWKEAEQMTAILLGQIQPSKRSEESRKAVINYVKRLIERELDCKIFSFGSVPLKTYLPDGDIDLTAISQHHGLNDDWAKKVSAVLEREEHIYNSEFHVKEVKWISAEVPVVKCLVENIIVDITFNQLGGLSTLCFLEEVDTLIGRDHLFKRSIILVKAWCFYESRILGAHHGLLSTYALEVLVLYIFHVFHHSLRGPLEVLFRFLQFFSKFDWEQNCLSLRGPVPLVLLHSMTEGSPHSSNGNFLLSEDFLKACREKYSALPEINQSKTFSQKFMNLVDPLRPFNNLGRSVNSGNLVRIYSAFAYGATQLEKLLQSPKEQASENLASFFRNTQKHCQGHRPDAGVLTFQVDIPLCNGKLSNDEATSDVTAISNGLKDVVSLKHGDADVAAGKRAHGNVYRSSLQVHEGSGLVDCLQTFEFRDTDAAILKGDHETYFQNLKDGLLYRNSHMGRNSYTVCHSQGSAWEGPGRPAFLDCFSQNPSSRKNLPFQGGSSCGPNSSIFEAFPKHQRGTGTFFPHLKHTFERDRRVYSNGVRSPQGISGNTDSFDSFNHNASSGFRSRSHMPKKRDGTSKLRFRRSMDLKTGEQQQNLLTEDGVLQSPTMGTVENFAHSPQRHVDNELSGDHRLMELSPRSLDSTISSASGNSRDLPLEKLEFGSFGPGFLAQGLQKASCNERAECVSQNQHLCPRGTTVETQAPASKAGDIVDQQISAYQLKEEDFPPLPLTNNRELSSTVVAERNTSGTQGSYHQACLLNHSPKATKVAQNR